ncbi:MAG: hypothetical protein RIQ64_2226 [Actinomycetota bacterium]|jgi:hypothetical protein
MKAGLATSLSIAGVLITGGAALALNSSILDTESAAKGSPALATVVGLEAQGGITPLGDGNASATVSGLSATGVADVISGEENPVESPMSVASETPAVTATPTTATDATGAVVSPKNRGTSGAIKQTQAGISATESTVETSPSTSAPTNTPITVPPVAPPTSVAPSTEKQFKVGDAATITLVASGSKLLVKDIAVVPGSGYKVTNQTSRDGDDVRITLTSPARTIEFSARLVNGQIMAAVGSPSSGNLNPPRPPHHDDDDHDGDERREHDEDEKREHHEDDHDDDDD